MRRYDAVIFDLDGTLLDTSPGIFGSVRYTERKMSLPPIGELELRDFIGPPPKQMYKKVYGLSDFDATRATLFHREYGHTYAVKEAEVYGGITETLDGMVNRNQYVTVATLKKQEIAEEILSNYGLRDYFTVVVGMNKDESMTKADTIKSVIRMTGARKPIMIGDTDYDYLGAKEVGVDFLGVTYGFGFIRGRDYPFKTVDSPVELLKVV